MTEQSNLSQQTAYSLQRLLPRLQDRYRAYAESAPQDWALFLQRLQEHFAPLFERLLALYGQRYDFFYYLEELLYTMAAYWSQRPAELKALDAAREADPHWFQSERMLGAVCYVDLFAGDLNGIRDKIPYFKELGLTYLHLMPLFLCPEEENDGGYAVSSYRQVNPALGTVEQLTELVQELRREGISLVLDFVFNHTSDEHEWARRAQAGQPLHQDYYFLFPDRSMPDAYEAHLREIFPEEHPGAFSYRPDLQQWVWTTFHSYQWDLNYANPAVLNDMAAEMLYLANLGVEVLRLDALAFIWKRLGTDCENLPQAHLLVQAFNRVARIAAPAMLFKSEAIVHPDEVARYIDPYECQLSYNPTLMALLWEGLATRQVRLLRHSMQRRFSIHPDCAWVNYVRCHDDIGWTFSDEDAAQVDIHGFDHRQFLNAFYTGRFAGSFARGLPFQFNPQTRDMRISGTCASLAGLEKALREGPAEAVELAIRRILLVHSVILSIGGIPLLYLGDEVGALNDYGYRSDPARADDSRWVHRPAADWSRLARRVDGETVEGRIYGRLRRLIELRRQHAALAGGDTEMLYLGNDHVFGYVRQNQGQRLLVLANFSEREQSLPANELRLHGLSYTLTDLVSGQQVSSDRDLLLEAYRFVWLQAQ
ncbi:MAG: alpha-glucosidase C-terminal domain-containing protein [Chloroflexia bacterium]|nr:alpha-glucosidase C-terminal domain-containing protein [Chloroflexia bacterium]